MCLDIPGDELFGGVTSFEGAEAEEAAGVSGNPTRASSTINLFILSYFSLFSYTLNIHLVSFTLSLKAFHNETTWTFQHILS